MKSQIEFQLNTYSNSIWIHSKWNLKENDANIEEVEKQPDACIPWVPVLGQNLIKLRKKRSEFSVRSCLLFSKWYR